MPSVSVARVLIGLWLLFFGHLPLLAQGQPGASPPPEAQPQEEAGPYTGLVVDCRGLKLQPTLAPKIRRPDGSEVWGTVKVSEEFLLGQGIVAYVRDPKDLAQPEIASRIGKRPLWVKAVGALGTPRTDPVLSEEDAQRVLEENKKGGFLDQMRVVFLIDPPAKGR